MCALVVVVVVVVGDGDDGEGEAGWREVKTEATRAITSEESLFSQ